MNNTNFELKRKHYVFKFKYKKQIRGEIMAFQVSLGFSYKKRALLI